MPLRPYTRSWARGMHAGLADGRPSRGRGSAHGRRRAHCCRRRDLRGPVDRRRRLGARGSRARARGRSGGRPRRGRRHGVRVELRCHLPGRRFRLRAARPRLTCGESEDGGADQQDERSANISQPTQRQLPQRDSTAPGDLIVANVESGVKRSTAPAGRPTRRAARRRVRCGRCRLTARETSYARTKGRGSRGRRGRRASRSGA